MIKAGSWNYTRSEVIVQCGQQQYRIASFLCKSLKVWTWKWKCQIVKLKVWKRKCEIVKENYQVRADHLGWRSDFSACGSPPSSASSSPLSICLSCYSGKEGKLTTATKIQRWWWWQRWQWWWWWWWKVASNTATASMISPVLLQLADTLKVVALSIILNLEWVF